MANHDDDSYEGDYYVEDEPVEAYSLVHIQDPRSLPNNPPPVVVSNTELLSTLHRMEQNQSRYDTRLNTMESILEELVPRPSRHSRSHSRRGRRRLRHPTPRMLEYGDTTPDVNLPPGALISQGVYNAEGAPLDMTTPAAQPEGTGQEIVDQNADARPLAERLGITPNSLAMIVRMAEQEQRRPSQGNGAPPRPQGNGAPPEARRETGSGRTYRGVRGRGRGLIPNSRERRRRGPLIEYLPSQSESSQHTPDPRATGRTRPRSNQGDTPPQGPPTANQQATPPPMIPTANQQTTQPPIIPTPQQTIPATIPTAPTPTTQTLTQIVQPTATQTQANNVLQTAVVNTNLENVTAAPLVTTQTIPGIGTINPEDLKKLLALLQAGAATTAQQISSPFTAGVREAQLPIGFKNLNADLRYHGNANPREFLIRFNIEMEL